MELSKEQEKRLGAILNDDGHSYSVHLKLQKSDEQSLRERCIQLAVTAYPRVVGDKVDYTKKAQEIYEYITEGKVKE